MKIGMLAEAGIIAAVAGQSDPIDRRPASADRARSGHDRQERRSAARRRCGRAPAASLPHRHPGDPQSARSRADRRRSGKVDGIGGAGAGCGARGRWRRASAWCDGSATAARQSCSRAGTRQGGGGGGPALGRLEGARFRPSPDRQPLDPRHRLQPLVGDRGAARHGERTSSRRSLARSTGCTRRSSARFRSAPAWGRSIISGASVEMRQASRPAAARRMSRVRADCAGRPARRRRRADGNRSGGGSATGGTLDAAGRSRAAGRFAGRLPGRDALLHHPRAPGDRSACPSPFRRTSRIGARRWPTIRPWRRSTSCRWRCTRMSSRSDRRLAGSSSPPEDGPVPSSGAPAPWRSPRDTSAIRIRLGVPGEDLPWVHCPLPRGAGPFRRLGGRRRRREFGRRGGTRSLPARGAGDAGPSRSGHQGDGQVLGQARHREPHRRRRHPGAAGGRGGRVRRRCGAGPAPGGEGRKSRRCRPERPTS